MRVDSPTDEKVQELSPRDQSVLIFVRACEELLNRLLVGFRDAVLDVLAELIEVDLVLVCDGEEDRNWVKFLRAGHLFSGLDEPGFGLSDCHYEL